MSRRRAPRLLAVEVGRAAIGVWHALRALRGSDERVLDTVLAVRQLGQAALVVRTATPEAHTLSALVDAAHGASMVPTALAGRRRRRFAGGQVWIAVALTVAEVAAVGSGRGRRRPGRMR